MMFSPVSNRLKLRPVWNSLSCHPETDIDFYLRVITLQPAFLAPYILLAKYNDKPAALLVGRIEKTIIRPKLGYAKFPAWPVKQIVFVCYGSENISSSEITDAIVEYYNRTS